MECSDGFAWRKTGAMAQIQAVDPGRPVALGSGCSNTDNYQFNRAKTMGSKTCLKPANAAPAVGPYSQAVRCGDLLFCAGQIPVDPATGNLIEGDIEAQTHRVLQNVRAILESENLSFKNVVKSTVFMIDLAEFTRMNGVYSQYFTADFPARSTVQVAALPKAARVEIEVIAHY
jgi:2-iminobutanoate/2-iminopropanoate deaminase